MGNCCSTSQSGSDAKYERQQGAAESQSSWVSPFAAPKLQQVPLSARDKNQMEKTWKSTGLIALRDAGLKTLPNNITSAAVEGKVLDATNNSLREPSSIAVLASMTNLQRLVLSNNQLITLPGDIVRQLTNLKFLNMDSNRLESLPEQLGGLVKLELLSVCHNSLTELPSTLVQCKKLRKLAFKGNQLTVLPAQLPEELEEINAAENRITVIPTGWSTLIKLTTLNLDTNQVATVPPEVFQGCVALHTLSLHHNPINADTLQSNPAFEEFEQRRRKKYDKAIGGGAMLSSKGLDEGVDRKV